MKLIKIANKDLFAIVDDEDYERCCNFTWQASGRSLNVGRFYRNGKCRFTSMASFIMMDERSMYDHKDRNPLNMQKVNLRKATYAQNAWNRTKSRGKSKYKGVDYIPLFGKWRARLTVNNDRKCLGHFDSERDAALAYNAAAVIYHKDFAVLNIVTGAEEGDEK